MSQLGTFPSAHYLALGILTPALLAVPVALESLEDQGASGVFLAQRGSARSLDGIRQESWGNEQPLSNLPLASGEEPGQNNLLRPVLFYFPRTGIEN